MMFTLMGRTGPEIFRIVIVVVLMRDIIRLSQPYPRCVHKYVFEAPILPRYVVRNDWPAIV